MIDSKNPGSKLIHETSRRPPGKSSFQRARGAAAPLKRRVFRRICGWKTVLSRGPCGTLGPLQPTRPPSHRHPLGFRASGGWQGLSRLPFGASLLADSSFGGLDRPCQPPGPEDAEGEVGRRVEGKKSGSGAAVIGRQKPPIGSLRIWRAERSAGFTSLSLTSSVIYAPSRSKLTHRFCGRGLC